MAAVCGRKMFRPYNCSVVILLKTESVCEITQFCAKYKNFSRIFYVAVCGAMWLLCVCYVSLCGCMWLYVSLCVFGRKILASLKTSYKLLH